MAVSLPLDDDRASRRVLLTLFRNLCRLLADEHIFLHRLSFHKDVFRDLYVPFAHLFFFLLHYFSPISFFPICLLTVDVMNSCCSFLLSTNSCSCSVRLLTVPFLFNLLFKILSPNATTSLST